MCASLGSFIYVNYMKTWFLILKQKKAATKQNGEKKRKAKINNNKIHTTRFLSRSFQEQQQ